MIGDILPPQVAVAEEFGDVLNVALFPEEEAAMANAVDKRRREFAAARACAREALAKLGLPPVPIVPGLCVPAGLGFRRRIRHIALPLASEDNPGLFQVKIEALPAGITKRVGRCYPAPVTASAWSQRRGPIPLPLIAESPSGRSLRCPRPWWSRPMPTDGCSVVARMPRYAPAGSGIRSESWISATALLIRGFGVQVPGGAPGGLHILVGPVFTFGSGVLSAWWPACAVLASLGCRGGAEACSCCFGVPLKPW
jgi:4'-phosphopantetheinyl transferase N-terminal domain